MTVLHVVCVAAIVSGSVASVPYFLGHAPTSVSESVFYKETVVVWKEPGYGFKPPFDEDIKRNAHQLPQAIVRVEKTAAKRTLPQTGEESLVLVEIILNNPSHLPIEVVAGTLSGANANGMQTFSEKVFTSTSTTRLKPGERTAINRQVFVPRGVFASSDALESLNLRLDFRTL